LIASQTKNTNTINPAGTQTIKWGCHGEVSAKFAEADHAKKTLDRFLLVINIIDH